MTSPLAVAAIVVGLYLLTRAADEFVTGAARLSLILKIPPVVIGAVVVGFGTSAPEMVVSAVASGQGKLDIAAGNIVGSNVANLTVVLGIAALLCTMHIDSKVLKREAPLAGAATLLFAVSIQGGLERWEGVVLLLALVAALALLFVRSDDGDRELAGEVDEYLDDHGDELSSAREAVRAFAGLVGVIIGAQLTVYGAATLADDAGLGQGFVGLTVVALGTSLPELMTAIAAARRGEEELIVGNLLGSNLFNSLAVGGIAGLVGPGSLQDAHLAGLATWIMIGVTVVTVVFMTSGRIVEQWEAILLIVAYVATIPLLGVSGASGETTDRSLAPATAVPACGHDMDSFHVVSGGSC